MSNSLIQPIVARDIMATRLITLRPETDVLDAIELLLKHQISGAPVVNDQQQLLGMFTEMCCMRVVIDAAYEQLPTVNVERYMDRNTVTIDESTDVLSIAQLFVDTQRRRVPVLREGRVVGQVSRRDVIRAVSKRIQNVPERKSALLYLSALRKMGDAPQV